MSIIFEALKKIEKEKGESPFREAPIDFTVHEGAASGGSRANRSRRILLYAAIVIPCAFFALLLIRPDWFSRPLEAPRASASAPAAQGLTQPIIKEVRLQPKTIVPSGMELASKPRGPAAHTAVKEADVKLPDLQLKGLSHSGNRSWAFINDKMLKEGDVIEGAEIVEISSNRVSLKYRDVEFTLTY